MYDLVIIGAGASGMAAALSAKKENPKAKVLILEALPRVGKKILATGNGRCNLTNFSATPESYGNPFVASVIKQYPPEKIVSFFSSIGLESVSDSESRVYPMSNMASSVLDCLRFEIERLGIEVLTETKAESVKSVNGIFIINSKMRTKKLIVSAGGKASPSQGSDGSGYELLRSLGHRITPLYAGLVQLTVKENLIGEFHISLHTVQWFRVQILCHKYNLLALSLRSYFLSFDITIHKIGIIMRSTS